MYHQGCYDPCGYNYGVAGVQTKPGNGFALIVVLFILLVIIGASFKKHC
ncbi:sporulation protein YjcZ [Salipaludibacillus keqinensis]|uniref:Sporulation protein YjcZ n=1 Tax=Salipaludibacillus keqinensis TaxID=2045207 RepID=A0A323TD86_9BACI|nr:YjcZ family sporulation protein [Salipaludibacillus keqinensis]PYZ92174.1 sporulation protein YjcZ [Salipaludibacillus keqinensis]